MRLVWLSWYLVGLLALLSILASLITYAPGAGRFETVIQIAFPSAAIVGVVVALWLTRLPQGHWVHQSKSLWAGFVAMAVTGTLLVILVG